MPALKEFANFITLNTANLADTYTQLLEESGDGYELIAANHRMSSARKLLKAVTASYESGTSAPLLHLFDESADDEPRRWSKDIAAPHPLLEIECLGQTLAPVVTDLESSKFLWQLLSEVRTAVLKTTEQMPPATAPVKASPETDESTPVAAAQTISVIEPPTTVSTDEWLGGQTALLRTLIDSSPDLIYVKDTESRILISNITNARAVGLDDPEALIGKTDRDFYPEEMAGQFLADDQRVIQSGESLVNQVEPGLAADGTRIWVSTTKIPFYDNQGRVAGIVGIGRDITDRKMTEEKLQASEDLFRSALDALPQNIYRKDRDDRVIFANKAYLSTVDMTLEELVGKTTYDLYPKELADKYAADDLKVIETGEAVDVVEAHEVPASGQTIYVRVVKTPITETDGTIIGTQGIFWDVTERVEAEKILAKRANELETVAEVGTIISTIFDTQELLQTVVDLTKERFGLYHAHIYLLNRMGDALDLAAGAGGVGRQMAAEGWRIPLHQEQSLVARAARTKKGFIVNNVREEAGWLPNPSLPDTKSELAVPLIVGGEMLGVMDVQSDKENYFHNEDLHIQTILGAQIAVAIQNAGQHEKTHTALTASEILAREQAVLYELGQALTARLSVDQVLEEAYRQASRLIDTSNFYIGLYDEENAEIEFSFIVSDSEIDKSIKKIPVSEGIAGYIVRNKISLLFEDNVRARQEALGIKLKGQESQSWLGVPLMVGDRVLGVMAVQSFTTSHLYDEHSQELLSAIGSQAAIALQNAILFENITHAQQEAEARLHETQILQKFTQKLAGTLEVNDVIEAFFEASTALTDADYVIFSLVDQAHQRVRAVSGFNVTPDHLANANHPLDSDDIMADIIRTGQTEIIVGWDERFDPAVFAAEGMDDWGQRIFTPVKVRQETLGLVEVGYKEQAERAAQETQVKLLRTLVDQAAIALESAQRYEMSRKAARREQVIREITDKLRSAANLEELVQTAATALGQHLSAEYAVVELGVDTRSNGSEGLNIQYINGAGAGTGVD